MYNWKKEAISIVSNLCGVSLAVLALLGSSLSASLLVFLYAFGVVVHTAVLMLLGMVSGAEIAELPDKPLQNLRDAQHRVRPWKLVFELPVLVIAVYCGWPALTILVAAYIVLYAALSEKLPELDLEPGEEPDETQVDTLLNYAENQQSPEAFEDFLKHRQDEENEE